MSEKRIRVLVAKPGLDGHDQGAKIVARALADAGFEVIYTGLRQTPQDIVTAALQEDVDVIGLSSMSGAHIPFCEKLQPLLRQHELDDKLWLVGGYVPSQDHESLKAIGVDGIFPASSKLADIVDFIKENVK